MFTAAANLIGNGRQSHIIIFPSMQCMSLMNDDMHDCVGSLNTLTSLIAEDV